jgi:hypothetical protein
VRPYNQNIGAGKKKSGTTTARAEYLTQKSKRKEKIYPSSNPKC